MSSQSNKGHHRDAYVKGGWGRSLQNKLSKGTKHRLDRRVDKRRRREDRQSSTAVEQ